MKVHVVNGALTQSIPRIVVIVDVFRASSTIAAALGNGAESIIPISSIRNTIRYAKNARNSKVVAAGERYGVTPRGFTYGASPFEMTTKNVRGKIIAYSSTNLTRILSRITRKSRVLVGCLNNAKAVANYTKSIGGDEVIIVACGTKQGPAIEDLIGAGAIVDYLMTEDLTDDALVALGLYRNPDWRILAERGRVAGRLRGLGLNKDIDFCLALNTSAVVPGLVGKKIVNLSGRLLTRF